MKYYLAYGSNLNMAQMARRCPDAIPVGYATINNMQLLFKGSKTGSYLTVEKKYGSKVPVGVWAISDEDEMALDLYEGYPNFYYKQILKLRVYDFLHHKAQNVEALIYIMHEERLLGTPRQDYIDTCLEGYQRFGFDINYLRKALENSIDK
jgi:hypothetical protein